MFRWIREILSERILSRVIVSSSYTFLDQIMKALLLFLCCGAVSALLLHGESISKTNQPPTVSLANNVPPPRMDIFLRSADEKGQIVQKYHDGQWSGWIGLEGKCAVGSAPDACSWGSGRIDVFIRGVTNDLLHKYYDRDWSEWESLGGNITSDPCAVSWGPDRIDVFARGDESDKFQVLQKTWNETTGWSGWTSLGGTVIGRPDACSWGRGRLDLFTRGEDNALQHKYFSDGQWSAWESLDGFLTSSPGVESWGEGRIDVFVRSNDEFKQVVQKYFRAGQGWSDWVPMGGMPAGSPTVCSRGPGQLDLFVRSTDDTLHHRSYNSDKGGWIGWVSLGGILTSDPGAVSWTSEK